MGGPDFVAQDLVTYPRLTARRLAGPSSLIVVAPANARKRTRLALWNQRPADGLARRRGAPRARQLGVRPPVRVLCSRAVRTALPPQAAWAIVHPAGGDRLVAGPSRAARQRRHQVALRPVQIIGTKPLDRRAEKPRISIAWLDQLRFLSTAPSRERETFPAFSGAGLRHRDRPRRLRSTTRARSLASIRAAALARAARYRSHGVIPSVNFRSKLRPGC
jgi:hypothetical protein